MNKRGKKKAQVWVETVIYTLIAFSLIAAVLVVVRPKIEEAQDKALVEQSINLMKTFDSRIKDAIQGGSGNKRILEISIKEGTLEINGINDEIIFEMESDYIYSEIGKTIPEGNLLITTQELGTINLITINRSYEENVNITFNNQEELKTLTKASTSYLVSVTNLGQDSEDKWHIDVELN